MRITFSHAFLIYARPADRQPAQCANLTGVSLSRAHLERRMALQRPNAQFREARVARREEPRLGGVFGAPRDNTARARLENGGRSESFSLRNAKREHAFPKTRQHPSEPEGGAGERLVWPRTRNSSIKNSHNKGAPQGLLKGGAQLKRQHPPVDHPPCPPPLIQPIPVGSLFTPVQPLWLR